MFGDTLRKIRLEKNIKQKDLGNSINKTKSYIYRIEKNLLIPPLPNFIQICEALKVNYEQLKKLHFEYEKLIKPFKTEELILKHFAESDYIFSLLLEKMFFKEDFIFLYKNAFNGNKYIIFDIFLQLINFLLIKLSSNEDNKNFSLMAPNAKNFYYAIDIYKQYSDQLVTIEIEDAKTQEEKLLKLIPQIVIEIRQYFKRENKKTFDDIFNSFLEKYNLKNLIMEIFPDISSKLLQEKINNIKNLTKKFLNAIDFINEEGRYCYKNEYSIFFAKDLPLVDNFYKYSFKILEFINLKYSYFIELNNKTFKIIKFSFKFDEITIRDIAKADKSPFENRFDLIKTNFQKIFNIIKEIIPLSQKEEKFLLLLDRIIRDTNVLIYYLKAIERKVKDHKKYENIIDKLQQENTLLTIEIQSLKSQLQQLQSELDKLKGKKG